VEFGREVGNVLDKAGASVFRVATLTEFKVTSLRNTGGGGGQKSFYTRTRNTL
jgi:hypothetical protein